jgi:hypothetical protein
MTPILEAPLLSLESVSKMGPLPAFLQSATDATLLSSVSQRGSDEALLVEMEVCDATLWG